MRPKTCAALGALFCLIAVPVSAGQSWIHQGFADFSQGKFDDGGSNLYVNAGGVMELIHRWDVNNDGCVDLVLADNHDNLERGPTDVFTVDPKRERGWKRKTIANDSGFMTRIVDLDKDGVPDLIAVNTYNGVTGEQPSCVYWGGAGAPTDKRTDMPTVGAYDVAIFDINRDGQLDLVFPSAWKDPHNPAIPRPCNVYLQQPGRKFTDATEAYGLTGVGATSIAAADLNKDSFVDIVLTNSRMGYDSNTDSFIYWGAANGFSPEPQKLPTRSAGQVVTADMNRDGFDDVFMSCSGGIRIYWNKNGAIDKDNYQVIQGGRFAVADVDGDKIPDMVTADSVGVFIRSGKELDKVVAMLPLSNPSWITAADLNGDGRPDLIVSRYMSDGRYETESAVFWNGPDGFATSSSSSTCRPGNLPACAWFPTHGAMGNSAGDLDGDGKSEVVFNSTASGHTESDVPSYIYLGDKSGYSVKNRLALPTAGTAVCGIADLDRDGYNDIAFNTMSVYAGGNPHGGIRLFWGSKDGIRPEKYIDLEAPNTVVLECRVADFNKDGYLDVLAGGAVSEPIPEQVAVASTIFWGSKGGFSNANNQRIANYGYYGGANGYSKDHRQSYLGGYSTGYTGIADYNRDGNLDLMTTGYQSASSRVLPAQLFWGNGREIDFRKRQDLFSEASTAVVQIDLNRDGWIDAFVLCHRNDIGHQVDSRLYWNSLKGFSEKNVTLLPGLGPHGTTVRDFGNAYTREPWEDYVSPAYDVAGAEHAPLGSRAKLARISWLADIPADASLKFQLRWASTKDDLDKAEWSGPLGKNSFYERPGEATTGISADAKFIQYKARFTYLYGCLSPKLRQVRVDFE